MGWRLSITFCNIPKAPPRRLTQHKVATAYTLIISPSQTKFYHHYHNQTLFKSLSNTMQLPQELLHDVLLRTDLVVHWRPGMDVDGLLIEEGKIVPSDDGPPGPGPDARSSFPLSLSQVSEQFRDVAQQVIFSKNRLIFTGHPTKTLSFLREQKPELLKLIRDVDFLFFSNDPKIWQSDKPAYDSAWRETVEFVNKNLDIPNLSLSLNTGPAFDTYEESLENENDLGYVRDFYQALTQPFQDSEKFKQLREFRVFLACSHQMEAELEKKVMGQDYNSPKQGKIPVAKRNPWFPHGTPKHPDLDYDYGLGTLAPWHPQMSRDFE